MAITREEIVGAALAQLDEAGLAALTLRRLADRLGIRAPTLYWHVRDKQELLDLVAGAIMGAALDQYREPPPGQPWWEWLAHRARGQRAALLAHPDGAIVVSGNRPTGQTLPGIELQLRALADAGFPPQEGLLALLAVNAYVIGEALDVQREAARAAPPPDQPRPGDAVTEEVILGDGYPLLRAAMLSGPPEQRFEHGLDVMITGLRARLARLAVT